MFLVPRRRVRFLRAAIVENGESLAVQERFQPRHEADVTAARVPAGAAKGYRDARAVTNTLNATLLSWPVRVLSDAWRFVRWQWLHVALAPFAAITVVTLTHELAHCAMVLLQGGTVTELVFLPSTENYGHMSYEFAPGALYSATLVSLGPTLLWSSCAAFVTLLALQPWRLPPWLASTTFVWLYVVPFLDISMHTFDWALLGSRENDYAHAFGPAVLEDALVALVFFPALGVVTWLVQWRLYRERGLSIPAFLVVVAAGVAAAVSVATAVSLAVR